MSMRGQRGQTLSRSLSRSRGVRPYWNPPKTCSSQVIQQQVTVNPRQIMRKHAHHAAPEGILLGWTAFDAKHPRSKDDVFGVPAWVEDVFAVRRQASWPSGEMRVKPPGRQSAPNAGHAKNTRCPRCGWDAGFGTAPTAVAAHAAPRTPGCLSRPR